MLPRYFTDKLAKYGVLITALVSILVLLAIAVFIIQGGLPLFSAVNPFDFLFGQSWSPTYDEYGILSMIVGSLLVKIGRAHV